VKDLADMIDLMKNMLLAVVYQSSVRVTHQLFQNPDAFFQVLVPKEV